MGFLQCQFSPLVKEMGERVGRVGVKIAEQEKIWFHTVNQVIEKNGKFVGKVRTMGEIFMSLL